VAARPGAENCPEIAPAPTGKLNYFECAGGGGHHALVSWPKAYLSIALLLAAKCN
jgi:hypothetical protein